jgi:REP element-mobilizing transposase RayT
MSVRKTALVRGEYYHIYSRGNSKQKIFLDDQDHEHFIKCLFLFNTSKNLKFRDLSRLKIPSFDFDRGETIVSIGAWKLMPNHFHIYITVNPHKQDLCKEGRNEISDFMQKVLTAYSKYFNLKYVRTGKLFEGEFKSVHLENDRQAKYNFSYIHLNCIKLIFPKWKEEGIKDVSRAIHFLSSYRWSSYLDYKGVIRQENKLLDPKAFPEYFSNINDFDKEILEWLNYGKD